LELGKRLADRGVLDVGADVFYVEWPELRSLVARRVAIDIRHRIAERKQAYERFLREKPPEILRSDGVPVGVASEVPADGILRGTGAAGGQGAGPVRVLREPDPNAMSDGDVIVVEFADPGWTPLFPRAAAIVMEVGGLMCHAAVVAREIGVPAVFGVTSATRLLHDGQLVVVDGDAGTIERIGQPRAIDAGATER
jgi:pyruvate,water dikinase